MKRTECINCGSTELYGFLDFGLQPNGNNFLKAEEIAAEPLLPLSVALCKACAQVQQGEVTSAEFLFSAHPYLTGVSRPYVEHFERLAPHLIQTLGLQPGATVLDIGCNDGTLIGIFARHGVRGFGVDPGSQSGLVAAQAGHLVFPVFWDEKSADCLAGLGLQPDLIVSTAAFYHMPYINDWVAGLAKVMGERSAFVAQCVYLGDVVKNGQVDQFYHEHSCLHSVKPLKALFERHGLRLFHVEPIDVQGGSILVFACRQDSPFETRGSVADFLASEAAAGLDQPKTYDRLRQTFESNGEELRALLGGMRARGERVFAIGASLRGVSLLNFMRAPQGSLDRMLEVNDYKIGRFSPGLHTPVVDERTETEEPDAYLVLSWTFRDFFLKKYAAYLKRGGKLIFPVPELEVVSGAGTAR